jgi:hypothetical protein
MKQKRLDHRKSELEMNTRLADLWIEDFSFYLDQLFIQAKTEPGYAAFASFKARIDVVFRADGSMTVDSEKYWMATTAAALNYRNDRCKVRRKSET